jgi:hypothetical protein
MTDEKFKEEFFKDSAAAVKRSGYAVDKMETNALSKLKPEDVEFNVNKKLIGEAAKDGSVELTVGSIKSTKQPGSTPVTRPKENIRPK